MRIKDIKNKYIIEVDLERFVINEIPTGYWRLEDIERLHTDYKQKIVPLLKGKKWAKCVDLRGYKMSMITEDLKEHIKWATKNGFTKGAIIVDESDIYKSVINLQMAQSSEGTPVSPKQFTSKEEAFKWLESVGF